MHGESNRLLRFNVVRYDRPAKKRASAEENFAGVAIYVAGSSRALFTPAQNAPCDFPRGDRTALLRVPFSSLSPSSLRDDFAVEIDSPRTPWDSLTLIPRLYGERAKVC